MRTLVIGTSLALALLTGPAWGKEDRNSASYLLPACRSFMSNKPAEGDNPCTPARDEGRCSGIIDGVDEAAADVCVRDGVTRGQMVLTVIKYIDARPQRMERAVCKACVRSPEGSLAL
jgi:Rap1a immunity proteins